MTINPADLLGSKEAAEHIGISRSRFKAKAGNGELPDPLVVLGCGPIWAKPQFDLPDAEE